MTGRLDYSLARIDNARVRAVPGGHELSTTVWVARVDGDRLCHDVAVAELVEVYEGWEARDYQAANLTLRRRARDTLRDLATAYARESD